MKVGTVFEIAYAHRLLNYDGKCANLHGHNGKVELEVEGVVNSDTGMLLDFVTLKERVVNPLMGLYDHATILQKGDSLLEAFEGYVLPSGYCPRVVVITSPPTAETLAQYFLDYMLDELDGVGTWIKKARVRFWETSNCYAEASF